MKKNNMKNTKPLIAFFNAMIFFYLLTVFFHWDWNPENWGEVSRLAYVLFAPVISLGIYGYTSEIQEKNNEKL
jgi:hypothetical protein